MTSSVILAASDEKEDCIVGGTERVGRREGRRGGEICALLNTCERNSILVIVLN